MNTISNYICIWFENRLKSDSGGEWIVNRHVSHLLLHLIQKLLQNLLYAHIYAVINKYLAFPNISRQVHRNSQGCKSVVFQMLLGIDAYVQSYINVP